MRLRRGLTQGQVAEYAQISQSTLSDLERGVISPKTLVAVANLSKYFGTTADYFLGLTSDPASRRGEPLPDQVLEVVELLLGMTPQRQHDVLAMVQALVSVDDQAADHLQTYDRMMD
jgi:transcriptional regulator with XRE-family HTH domain